MSHTEFLDACVECASRRENDLHTRVTELEAELLESARLHGMGSEREARLMTKVSEMEQKLQQAEALASTMRHALEQVRFEDDQTDNLTSYVRDLVDAALSDSPPSRLDAAMKNLREIKKRCEWYFDKGTENELRHFIGVDVAYDLERVLEAFDKGDDDAE